MPEKSVLGVVIVTYNSSDVILDCLESLLSSGPAPIKVLVVDNKSTDDTVQVISNWASGRTEYVASADIPISVSAIAKPIDITGSDETGVQLVSADSNNGFAAGVNIGLDLLKAQSTVDRFWVLNPDCVVPTGTVDSILDWQAPQGGFALLGGRVSYLETPEAIHSDGGWVNMKTGVTGNINLGKNAIDTGSPALDDISYVSGACMVASRQFLEKAGPLAEDYFLYYEEVDWCLRRGSLPIGYCPDLRVYHRVGSSIGSATLQRGGSPFSTYFLYRARMIFMWKHSKLMLPIAYLYALAKAAQFLLRGRSDLTVALLRGINGLQRSDRA